MRRIKREKLFFGVVISFSFLIFSRVESVDYKYIVECRSKNTKKRKKPFEPLLLRGSLCGFL
jgi:hypothetical protein